MDDDSTSSFFFVALAVPPGKSCKFLNLSGDHTMMPTFSVFVRMYLYMQNTKIYPPAAGVVDFFQEANRLEEADDSS